MNKATEKRVYDLLKRRGPLMVFEISEALGTDHGRTRKALYRLQAKGCARASGARFTQRHSIVPGSILVDGRGDNNRSGKAVPRPEPAIELERCWAYA